MIERFLPLVLVAAIGCGEKNDTSTAAPEEAATESSEHVPGDKASQAYAERLFDVEITKFKVYEGDDIELHYDSLTFSPDGTWTGTGAVEIMDEKMECVEGGAWTMDPADSASTASMTWNLDKTNCAGRESGSNQRVRLTLEKDGTYKVELR